MSKEAAFGLNASTFESGASDSESGTQVAHVETSKSETEYVCDDCSQRLKLESLGGVVSSANEKLKLCPGQVFTDSSIQPLNSEEKITDSIPSLNFPANKKEETLSDCTAEKRFGKSHSDKKRKVESLESGKPEKKTRDNRQKVAETCSAMRAAIPLRVGSEMDHTLKPCGDSHSISKPEVENKKMKKPGQVFPDSSLPSAKSSTPSEMNRTAAAQLLYQSCVQGKVNCVKGVDVDVDGCDIPNDTGSGGHPTVTFGTLPPIRLGTTGRSGFDKNMSDKASSSKEEDVDIDDEDDWVTKGRPYIKDATALDAVNVYIDLQTTMFRDGDTAYLLVDQIKSILRNLPPLADGTKYRVSEMTCYVPSTDPDLEDIGTLLNELGIRMKEFELRKAFCRVCRPHQIPPPRPVNLRKGKKRALLELELAGDLLWHVLELEEHGELVNSKLPKGKKGKVPQAFRNTVMLITGDQRLTGKIEECLDGCTLVKEVPSCLERKVMSMTKASYRLREPHVQPRLG